SNVSLLHSSHGFPGVHGVFIAPVSTGYFVQVGNERNLSADGGNGSTLCQSLIHIRGQIRAPDAVKGAVSQGVLEPLSDDVHFGARAFLVGRYLFGIPLNRIPYREVTARSWRRYEFDITL
ncbi:hypothetical protein, partial [Pantoea agglomerans]|uniref:hypothetical protein n=1 Tax=Enterobacter agglomerans TaxID=549 RepID=UPI001A933C0E